MDKVREVFRLACSYMDDGQRYGQALFNVAAVLMPKAAESARGDFDLDPFHIDGNVNRFIAHLYEIGE